MLLNNTTCDIWCETFCMEGFHSSEISGSNKFSSSCAFEKAWVQENWTAAQEAHYVSLTRVGLPSTEKLVEDVDHMRESCLYLFTKYPLVACHGDSLSNNILYDEKHGK